MDSVHTSISMLKEGDAERYKNETTNNKIGGHAVHSMKDWHQRSSLLQLKLEVQQLALPQYLQIQAFTCL